MATFADSLKREIARVARKELREEIGSLRKSQSLQRLEISGLKKQILGLQSEVLRLKRSRTDPSTAPGRTSLQSTPDVTRSKPGPKASFTAERLKAQRARLGLTQEQMGRLLGVSSLSVWKWESGGAVPRSSRLPGILTRISLGKKEALAIINSA